MSFHIDYEDIAIGAQEDGVVTATSKSTYSDLDKVLPGVPSYKIATFERNNWLLDGQYSILDDEEIAYWSSTITGSNRQFTTQPTITVTFDNLYSLDGLTFMFDRGGGHYATAFTITWYRNDIAIDTYNATADDAFVLVEHPVSYFDKIVVAFASTELPYMRVKVERFVLGVIRRFGTDELIEAKINNAISLVADTVPINTLSFRIISRSDVQYMFQRKQVLRAYIDDAIIGTYYLKSSSRTGTRNYSVEAQDYIGNIDTELYSGGLWFASTPLQTVLAAIFGSTDIFVIDDAYSSSQLRGFIPAGTKRDALHLIAFALSAIVDTLSDDKIHIFPASTVVKSIPSSRVYSGGRVAKTDVVTAAYVTGYEITNEPPSDDDDYVDFNGAKYKTVKTIYAAVNPLVSVADIPNEVSVDGVYLVNSDNGQAIADTLIAYYQRRQTYNVKHIVDGEQLGDKVDVALPWSATVTGHMVSMNITVSHLIASDSRIILTDI